MYSLKRFATHKFLSSSRVRKEDQILPRRSPGGEKSDNGDVRRKP